MNVKTANKQTHQAALVSFLGVAIGAPVLLDNVPSLAWLPNWAGAAVALCGLFAALIVFWRSGALKARYLALFAGALGVAALAGWPLAGYS